MSDDGFKQLLAAEERAKEIVANARKGAHVCAPNGFSFAFFFSISFSFFFAATMRNVVRGERRVGRDDGVCVPRG